MPLWLTATALEVPTQRQTVQPPGETTEPLAMRNTQRESSSIESKNGPYSIKLSVRPRLV